MQNLHLSIPVRDQLVSRFWHLKFQKLLIFDFALYHKGCNLVIMYKGWVTSEVTL